MSTNRLPKRALVVTNYYPPFVVGGAEIVAHRHARLLRERGWTVAVMTGVNPSPTQAGGTLSVDVVDGIEVFRVVHRSLEPGDNFRWPVANRYLTSLLTSFRPEIVHMHNLSGLGADMIRIAKRAGIRTVVTLHDNWGYCYKNTRLRNDNTPCTDTSECHLCLPSLVHDGIELPTRLRTDYVRWCLQQADALISPSHDLARRYGEGGFETPRIRVLSNGIDLARIAARERCPGDRVKFLYAAYLGEHKGVAVLLDAIRHLADDPDLHGRWALTIVGDGHLAARVRQTIEMDRWENAVTFIGRQSRTELLHCMRDADAVINASIWPENQPVILLEAIASGAVPIASRLGGNVELITDGEDGLLFEPRDARSLADAMCRLIRCKRDLTRMSAANVKRRAAFDEGHSIDQLEEVLSAEAAPDAAPPRTEAVVMCAGACDLRTMMFIGQLSTALPELTVKLIWHEWADETLWQQAKACWYWGGGPARMTRELAVPMKRGLPIVLPASPTAQLLAGRSGQVLPYRSMAEIGACIRDACEMCTPAVSGELPMAALQRLQLQLQPQPDFLMTAPP